MRTAIIGAGPAGLFLSHHLKRRRPRDEVVVIEQNPRSATFGFGVVFSDGALEFLRAGEPRVLELLEAQMERWPEQKIVHRDEAVLVDGNGFAAIGRLQLLTTLEGLCETAGVRIEYGRKIENLAEVAGFDLVVGADGVNSLLRRSLESSLRPRVHHLRNKFAWYGTTKAFECLTLTFRETEHGHFVAHHYRYAPDMSTFIVECDAATWCRAGLDRMGDEESRIYCERVFAPDLDGQPDRPVGQRLLGDGVAPLPGLDRRLLHRVPLDEAVEVPGVAPTPAVVIVAQLPGLDVADDRVEPVGELDEQADGLPLKERGGAVGGLGQAELAAGRRDRQRVADLGLDLDDVTHDRVSRAGSRNRWS